MDGSLSVDELFCFHVLYYSVLYYMCEERRAAGRWQVGG